MARIFGVFCTKICYLIAKNMDENGPLEFHTVLYSKYDENLENYQRITLGQVVCTKIRRFRCIFHSHFQFLAGKHMVLVLGKICDTKLIKTS